MKGFVVTMIANIFIEVSYVVCVTFAAIHFENARLLWWYLLALVIGYTFKQGEGKSNER